MYVIYIIYLAATVFSILRSFVQFSSPLPGGVPDLVIGLGVFDGVHRGHRRIVSALAEMAGRLGASPAAVTFSPHPRAVVLPEEPLTLLLPLDERLNLLTAAGAAHTGVIEFTREFAALEPEQFLEKLCGGPFGVAGICVGKRWRFGRGGAGDTAFLADWCAKRGIGFLACPEVMSHNVVVSSTAIRRLTAAGELDAAAEMLGRSCRIFGRVGPGFRVAGAELGAPTANLAPDAGVVPPDGVYACGARLEKVLYPAAVNIGVSPTFGGVGRRIEAHLLGFSGDLYGKRLEIELYKKMRAEKAFPDAAALKKQIAADIEETAAVFRKYCKGGEKQ